jgi:hypothetical protein
MAHHNEVNRQLPPKESQDNDHGSSVRYSHLGHDGHERFVLCDSECSFKGGNLEICGR